MEKDRKIKKYSVIALIVALLGLTVVYAAISVSLNINATARANKTGINVVFEKISGVSPTKSSGVLVTLDEPELKQSGKILNLGDITLNEPEDYYQYSINIVNKGKSAAKITGIDKPYVTELALTYFDVTFRYENGVNVGIDDTIAANQSKRVIIRIALKDLTNEQYEAMPDDLVLNLNNISITFEKDDSAPVIPSYPVLASNVESEEDEDDILYFGVNCPSIISNTSEGPTINSITFLSTNTTGPETTGQWDASQAGDGSVTASYKESSTPGMYDIYIGGNGGVSAPSNSEGLFAATNNVNFTNFDTSNITNATYMFVMYQGTSLNVSSLNLSNVTTMYGMFAGSELTSVTIGSTYPTTNVTDMSGLFSDCESLTSVTFASGFNTSNVTSMLTMFKDTAISSIDLSLFDTSNVETMAAMFAGCSNLSSITFGSSFDTSNVTNMYGMFQSVSAFTSLDLSSFDTSSVTSMYGMFSFYEDGNQITNTLQTLNLSSFTNLSSTAMYGMFLGCNHLTTLDIRNMTLSNLSSQDNYGHIFDYVPSNCLIIVKDATEKAWFSTIYSELTNVQTVAEYTAS